MRKQISLFLVFVFICAVGYAAEFVGQGEANYAKKKDIMAARDQALLRARADLLLKSVRNELVDADFEKVRSGLNDSSFLNSASGFIKNETIANENVLANAYQITIRGEVDLELLRNELKVRFGISSDTKSRKSVMLLVEEYFSADFAPETSRVSREETIIDNKNIIEDDKDIRRSGSNATYSRDKQSESFSARETHDDKASMQSKSNVNAKASESLEGVYNGKASLKASEQSSASASSKGSSAVSGSASSDVTNAKATSYSSKDQTHFFQDQSTYEKKVVEYFPPDALKVKNPVPFVSAIIESAMLKRDIKILDKDITDKLRKEIFGEKGLVESFTSGDSSKLLTVASKAGNEYGADMVVVGVNSIVDAGISGDMTVAKSSIALKVIDASTGEIVASYAYTQGGESTSIQTAAKISAQRLGSVVGPEISEQFAEYWKKRADRGAEFIITVVGLTSTKAKFDFNKVFKKLVELGKIEAFDERRFDKAQGIFELVVTSKQKITEFKDAFLEIVYEIPEYQNLEEESSKGNAILYKVK